MTRVLVVSNDLVRRSMAGPGIRNYELAHRLAEAGHEVTLATPGATDIEEPGLAMLPFEPGGQGALEAASRRADVVLGQGWVFDRHPELRRNVAHVVADLYDPFHLESLVAVEAAPMADQVEHHHGRLQVLDRQLQESDFFLCASERQRDFWLGALSSLNRINPYTHSADPALRSLIDCVPFGIPDRHPTHDAPALRGVIPGIEEGDLLLLWGGGIYNWFDPLTLLHGVARASRRLPRLRLVFHAGRHPNPGVGEMPIVARTRRLSEELGLTGRFVFFNDTWVPYAERARYLLEADVGVSTHPDHVETRFSFRTRVLDYLWARLPVLSTSGDALADSVEAGGWGLTVPPDDPGAIAAAIETLAEPEVRAACRERIEVAIPRLSWSTAAAPLLRYCANPSRAADLATGAGVPTVPLVVGLPEPVAGATEAVPPPPPGDVFERLVALHRREGTAGTLRVIRGRITGAFRGRW